VTLVKAASKIKILLLFINIEATEKFPAVGTKFTESRKSAKSLYFHSNEEWTSFKKNKNKEIKKFPKVILKITIIPT
jgi:hypothetical protein